jgi:peptidyl-prolyl cis-trans isomerase D
VQAANNFAGEVKNIKSFDEVFQKHLKPKGYNKGIAVEIRRITGSINGINGFARQLVKDIYAARPGEVLKPVEVNDNWIVAVVTEVNNEGTMSVAKVRPGVEAMLRHKKIGWQLKQKAGKISSLDAVTGLLGKPVQVIDSLRMNTGNPQADMPYDAKATGVIFNPSNKGKIYPELIVGEFGVYAIQVDNVSATATGENVTDWRKQQAGQAAHVPTQVLRDKATIKDRRASGTNNY